MTPFESGIAAYAAPPTSTAPTTPPKRNQRLRLSVNLRTAHPFRSGHAPAHMAWPGRPIRRDPQLLRAHLTVLFRTGRACGSKLDRALVTLDAKYAHLPTTLIAHRHLCRRRTGIGPPARPVAQRNTRPQNGRPGPQTSGAGRVAQARLLASRTSGRASETERH